MGADIHTCSYQCDRPACIRAQRDELAARAEQDAAEIGRLRGEVEFHRLDAGALRVQLDSCIERLEVQTKNALHLHAMMVDAEARAEQAIAPAEAKDPAPAMPNGVDGLAYAQRLAVAIWSRNYREVSPQWEVCEDLMGVLSQIDNMVSGMSAADNRDAAGVLREAFAKGDAPTAGYEKYWDDTPAAAPAGEAVAWRFYVEDHPILKPYWTGWGADKWFRDQMVKRGCRAEYAYLPAATPPAPVQAAPQEGEALPSDGAYMIVYDDQDMHPETFARNGARDAAMHRFEQISGNWNAHLYAKIRSNCRDVDVPDALAARPSACELGAEGELGPLTLRRDDDGKLQLYRVGFALRFATFSPGVLESERCAVFAALQHRGDSRGGEG